MKKLMILLVLLISLPFGSSLAGKAPLPPDLPETYLALCSIRGTETNGATFAVTEAYRDGETVKITVAQLPNDGNTSLVDNQVEYPPDDPIFLRELEEASQHGEKVLGTVCDILSAVDENGVSLMDGYMTSCDRTGPSLTYQFCLSLPQGTDEARVELIFGVNEDCGFRFTTLGKLFLSVADEKP